MKKSIRIAFVAVLFVALASVASFASAITAPGGGDPEPQVSSLSVVISAILSVIGL